MFGVPVELSIKNILRTESALSKQTPPLSEQKRKVPKGHKSSFLRGARSWMETTLQKLWAKREREMEEERDWFPSKGEPKVMQRRRNDGFEGCERSQSAVSAATEPPVECPVITTCFLSSIFNPCVICYIYKFDQW